MSTAVLTHSRRIKLGPRVVLFVRVGLRPPPARFFVPYLVDEICRASEDLDSHLRRHGIAAQSSPWCRFLPTLDNERYLVVEHGVDVGLDTARPDDWTLRLEREAAHDTVEYDVSGTLDELSTTAARLRADSLVGWRWMWHRIDPEAMAHRVTIVRDAPPGSG